MKWIDYAGTRLQTSDAIADAVLLYAVALARHSIADEVRIPVIGANGEIEEFGLLLGPASQFIVEPAVTSAHEPEDPALLELLTQRTRALGPIRPVAETGATGGPLDDYDLPAG